MWLRRAFLLWLLPAAVVLPAWLLVGWGVFHAGAWAFVWVLFIAIPSVLIGELVLTMLVRLRGTVRADRAVSWWDVLGFGVWHALTVAVGFYNATWFVPVLALATCAGLAVFWLSLWQLWREARGGAVLLRTGAGVGYIPPPAAPRHATGDPEVIVVTERPAPPRA